MTYKELLNIVSFEEVEPYIANMYSEAKGSLCWFKLHYDMLKLMIPKRHDESYYYEKTGMMALLQGLRIWERLLVLVDTQIH